MAFLFQKKQKNITSLSDEELCRYFSNNGKEEYFAELYRRYAHLVYGQCLKMLDNKEDSHDMTMEIFETLYSKIREQKDIQSFNFWIYSVVKNKCISFLRKRNKNTWTEYDQNIHENNPDLFMENEVFLRLCNEEEEKQPENLIEKAIGRLKKKEQRECITAFYLEELSYQQVSDKLRYPLPKVKSYIQNGKRNLKNIILEMKSKV